MKIKIPLSRFKLRIEREIEREAEFAQPEKPVLEIHRDYNKIFCIGFGKTGTTSMGKLLVQFGFKLGNQAVAEILAEDWVIHKRSDRIINFCYTADAFQDVPFFLSGLYKELDTAFPNSKFILTVRNTPDEWFGSLVRFHTKIFSKVKTLPPTEEDMRNALYRYKGWVLETAKYFWNYPAVPLYHKESYMQKYIDHQRGVKDYFKDRSADFIEINVGVQDDFQKLCSFLNVKTSIRGFPWENKT